jgi:EmrB/QacA subfamily drug resistance transporter
MSTRPESPAAKQPWTVLALVGLAQFMVVLDVTVVNVALPSIGRELDFAAADLQWVVTAYVLVSGGLLLLGGRAADLLGRRQVFLTGLLLFTAASLAAGLAPSAGALVAARASQGLGAALMSPAALSIVTTTYSGRRRVIALGVWGAIASAGAAAGVLFGGILTTLLSWEWVFFVNLPIGLATAPLAVRMVPASAPPRAAERHLDIPGALTVTSGLVLFVYAIEGADSHGWGSLRTLALLGAAAGLLAAFAARERAAARPLVPPAIWKVRSLVAGAGLMLGATGLMVGAFFLNSLYLQHTLGATALETGLAFLPLAVVIGAGAHVGSRLVPRIGARVVATGGLGLVSGGALLLAAAPDRSTYVPDLLPGFLVLGAGAGLAIVSASIAAMAEVSHDRAGLASGLLTTAHEVGAALGVAVLSAVIAGAAGGPSGYEEGFLAAAVGAGVLAVIALALVPSVRSAPAAGAMPH